MKGLLLVVAIISEVWTLLTVAAVSQTLSFNLESAVKFKTCVPYSDVVGRLRDLAKDANNRLFYGVPMMPPPVAESDPRNYFLVEIRASQDVSVTLALRKNDLYVMGYRDRVGSGYRGYFLKDAPEAIKDGVFGPLVQTTPLPYNGQYEKIEAISGSREKVKLGAGLLQQRTIDVYGKETPDERKQAQFVLLAIQMVAEAARFKYIESLVCQNIAKFEFDTNPKVISLENTWKKISVSLFLGQPTGLDKLKDENGNKWVVTNLYVLAYNVGVLRYTTGNNLGSIPMTIYDDELRQEDQ